MLINFRSDASLDIGTGHVMRCLTLADALQDRGATCCFICRSHHGNLLDLIRQRGFEAHALPFSEFSSTEDAAESGTLSPHTTWLGTDWATDAKQTLAVLGKSSIDWLIVDHYTLDVRWERSLRGACHRLMVIDDLADRPHNCDLLLDQNLGRKAASYADLVPEDCTILAGPQYALLRPEFAELRSYSLERRASPQVKRLLITMGGVDRDNVTGEVLEGLKDCPLPDDCHITVVMGPHAPWLRHVQGQAKKMPWTTEIKVNVSNMARLMAESDVAIGAAGSTSWERCCLGLPSMIVALAANQQPIAKALDDAGVAKATSGHSLKTDIQGFLCEICAHPESLARTTTLAANVTNGGGTSTVTQILFDQGMA